MIPVRDSTTLLVQSSLSTCNKSRLTAAEFMKTTAFTISVNFIDASFLRPEALPTARLRFHSVQIGSQRSASGGCAFLLDCYMISTNDSDIRKFR